tara:strand:+ start:907 stop:1311 length:405 start_codon:yes stop_codon:yes gene_type:complete
MTVPDKLPDDIAELKAIIRAQQDQNARLEALLASFKKALFGAKSEKIDPAQYKLELEDIETAIAQVESEIDADERTAPVRPQSRARPIADHYPNIWNGLRWSLNPTDPAPAELSVTSLARMSASDWTSSRPSSG